VIAVQEAVAELGADLRFCGVQHPRTAGVERGARFLRVPANLEGARGDEPALGRVEVVGDEVGRRI
jgi:hypothetical protein